MLDLVTLLYDDMSGICNDLGPVLRVVGIAIKIIQYLVPLLLIIFGSLDFFKAVTEKDEKSMKEAQNKFIQRAIVALFVFLVSTIVSVLMGIVGNENYSDCMDCVKHPFGDECKAKLDY